MVKRHQSVIVVIAVVADFLKEFFHVTFKHFSKVFLVLYIHIYIYMKRKLYLFFYKRDENQAYTIFDNSRNI